MRRFGSIAVLACSAIAGTAAATDKSPFAIHDLAGFELRRPAYRAEGDGTLVTVSLCRIVGWAATNPASVHFVRNGNDGSAPEHHDVRIARMGLKSGENCQAVAARFHGAPHLDEKIGICLAYSHSRCE